MTRYDWSRLHHIEAGKYGTQFVKKELELHGLDVDCADVDARRNELVIRVGENASYDVLVRTVRGYKHVSLRKDRFVVRPDLLVAVVILLENEPPAFYLIPSEAWQEPSALLVSRDYVGKKSPPEWRINLSRKNMQLLEAYAFDQVVDTLWPRGWLAALTGSANGQRRGLTVSHASEVGMAFDILLEQIEAANETWNEDGADALQKADYEQARELVEKGSQIGSLRDRVNAVREDWGNLFGPLGPRRRKQRKSSKAREQLERGLRTSEDAFRVPILQALVRLGGSAPMADVLDEVGRLMERELNEYDRLPLTATPDRPRWRNTAHWTRHTLRGEGLLASGPQRSTWEITEAGERWLRERSG